MPVLCGCMSGWHDWASVVNVVVYITNLVNHSMCEVVVLMSVVNELGLI